MVDFFEQQAAARRRTALCVGLYALAVLGVTVCVVPVVTLGVAYLTVALESKRERGRAVSRMVDQLFGDPVGFFSQGHNQAIVLVALAATLGLIFGASLVRYASLRRGGGAVAAGLGARRISPDTRDPDERRLVNVVEEMALASSVPVPDVYVMDREGGVNAFAAGHSPSDAVVAVTRGTLQRLNREQLQGVVAHEFSHILNGDMRLNLRLMGLLFGIGCVGLLGRILLQTGGRKNALPLVGLLLMVIGAVGVFFASLIRAMISRQREYLADASAVQFTRNPDGIGGALRVIGGTAAHGRVETRTASECSHMMFASSAAGWMEGPFATHPPLEDRIRRVDPRWDGTFLAGRPVTDGSPAAGVLEIEDVTGPQRDALIGMLGPAVASAALQTAAKPRRAATPAAPLVLAGGLTPGEVFTRVGAARETLASIPDALVKASRDAFTARALLLAMLLDGEGTLRQGQVTLIAAELGEATAQNARVLARQVRSASRGVRLPLIELSLGALGALSTDQYRKFRKTVKAVIDADSRVDLFELCLEQLLITHLDRKHVDARPVPVQYYVLSRLGKEVSTLLWAVAHSSEAGGTGAAQNVAAALKDLSLPPIS
ncbi:MAG TPA: M48 family metallopeptidase, partial [Phycisphaerales bacterium]|nr:M48 family metallopeptidase [Phycisphaerales bacterium]